MPKGRTVYAHNGERYFIVDGDIHNWSAGPDNRNEYSEGLRTGDL